MTTLYRTMKPAHPEPPTTGPTALEESGSGMLSLEEAAAFLKVSKNTLRRWTNEGYLPALRVGQRQERRFRREDLLAVTARPAGAPRDGASVAHAAGTTPAHTCVFCQSREEEWKIVGAAVGEQLRLGGQVIVIGEADRCEFFGERIGALGFQIEDLRRSERLQCLTPRQSYLKSGTFSADRALAFIEALILFANAAGYRGITIIGDSEWLFSYPGGVSAELRAEFLDYEQRLSQLFANHPVAEIFCSYNLSVVSGSDILALLGSHTRLRHGAHDLRIGRAEPQARTA